MSVMPIGRTSVRVVVGSGMAAFGTLAATWLGDHHVAWLGGMVGAVSGGFAPSVVDWLKDRAGVREARAAAGESAASRSPAALLDPRQAVADFVGRADELAGLIAW